MLAEFVAVPFGHDRLSLFNIGIDELDHFSALQTNEMIVMLAFAQLIGGPIRVKMVSDNQACTLELCENAVDGRETDVDAVGHQFLEDFFRGNMTALSVIFFRPLLKEFKDPQSRRSRLETGVL